MPEICEYRCDNCGFRLERGWVEYAYVTDDRGKRIHWPHPMEMQKVYEVLGYDASEELIKARTGTLTVCVCLDCTGRFELDLERDERRCPRCGSEQVKTVWEMVGKTCPKCGMGTIVEIDTGIVT